MRRKRYQEWDKLNINKHPAAKERYQDTGKIIKILTEKIDSGWSAFNDVSCCMCEGQLQYSHAATLFLTGKFCANVSIPHAAASYSYNDVKST